MKIVGKTLLYKREEVGGRLAVLLELKHKLGYNVSELTEALGFKSNLVLKTLKKELPTTDEMYRRANGLLELTKIQEIKGREWEIITRTNLITTIGKKISLEELSKKLGKDKKYMSNYIASGKLVGDELYIKLLGIYKEVLEAEEKDREKKRRARIFNISEVLDELIEKVNKLELLEDTTNIEDYYSKLNSKKRLIKRLKDLETKGVKEVTKHGTNYMVVR